MTHVAKLTFSPFQENTYVLYDDTNECIIIDPGCYDDTERQVLSEFIASKNLKPVRLINTHAHLDHVFGNKYVSEKYNLGVELHEGEGPELAAAVQRGLMFGVVVVPSPEPSRFIEEGEVIRFGNTELLTLFTPGHSIASISFYCEKEGFIIGGDVLFRESIGRTDLPGGNQEILFDTIANKFYTLPDETVVYSGHGPETTVGHEKKNNMFIRME